MDAPAPRVSLRTWLSLTRLPLVFTVLGNLLVAHAVWPVPAQTLLLCAVCGCLAYLGGMVLNDVADAGRDARLHPERPIPSGRITRSGAGRFGGLLIGTALLAGLALGWPRMLLAGGLVACVLLYNFAFKGFRLPGALMMAACRGLVVLMALGGLELWRGEVPWWPAAAVFGYTLLLTLLSTFEEGEGRAGPVGLVFSLLLLLGLGGLAVWQADALASVVWGLLGLSFAAEAWRQRNAPRPKGVGLMVRHLLFAFVGFDAGLALACGGQWQALAILALLVPIFVSRWWMRRG